MPPKLTRSEIATLALWRRPPGVKWRRPSEAQIRRLTERLLRCGAGQVSEEVRPYTCLSLDVMRHRARRELSSSRALTRVRLTKDHSTGLARRER